VKSPTVATCINFGCGQSPTAGWINYDNSPAILLARWPLLTALLSRLRLINQANLDFIAFCRGHAIGYADACRPLPHATGSVDVIYTSHMLEHLFREDAETFLRECHRVLRPGGVLRLAVPDLALDVKEYLEHGDADLFLAGLEFDLAKPRGLVGRLRHALVGGRGHRYLYDRRSLAAFVVECGFVDVNVVLPGTTRIKDHGKLDLWERASQGWYVEATRP
jgi:SAM-dependent methyltransferase